MNQSQEVGVIGAGSFGTAVANLLAEKSPVILVASNEAQANIIRSSNQSAGQKLNANIQVTHDLQHLASNCKVIFPIIPSQDFYSCMVDLQPYLNADHILIHGTMGKPPLL